MINTIVVFMLIAPLGLLLAGMLIVIELIYGKQKDDEGFKKTR